MAAKITYAFLLLIGLSSAAPAETLKPAAKAPVLSPAVEKEDLVEDLKPAASHWGGGWGYGGYGGWGGYGGYWPHYGSYWSYPSYNWGYGYGWPYYGSYGNGLWW